MNLKIADYFNIPLYFNIFTLPFVLLVYMSRPDVGLLSVAIYIFSMFFVLLHEYAHCFMARRFGWIVKDVTLFPLGGVARVFFRYDKPKEEILVALAGPLLNLALLFIFFPICIGMALYDQFAWFFVFMVLSLSNFMIFTFNLLPVYPMDGGRVLRAVLSCFIGHLKATWWAVRIGQITGTVLAVLAFMYTYYVAGVIFIFMIVIGQNELTHAKMVTLLYKMRADMCQELNKPELERATLSEMIQTLETIQDEELKTKLKTVDLIPLLKDLEKSNISI